MGSNGKQVAKRPKSEVDKAFGQVRRWWAKHYLGDVLGEVTLASALTDVGILSLGTLAKMLTNPKTSDKVRLQIALAMAPKMVAEARGRLRSGGSGAGSAAEAGLGGLLETYGVKVTAKT